MILHRNILHGQPEEIATVEIIKQRGGREMLEGNKMLEREYIYIYIGECETWKRGRNWEENGGREDVTEQVNE